MRKAVQLLPMIIAFLILCYTWYVILNTEYFATLKHKFALFWFIFCVVLYFVRFNYGLVASGLFLIVASINFVAFFPEIKSSSYFFKIGSLEMSTPAIQWPALFLLILYFIVNGSYLLKLYENKKK